jgi:WD40 repeat protein
MATSEPTNRETAQEISSRESDTSSFYVVGGTLATDAPSYVTRQADRQLREALWRGDFCYVLDTRQVGKSSLMVRTALFLKQQDIAVAILDLTRLGQSLNPDQWYYGLLLNLGAQIGKRDELRSFWQQNKELGPLQRCMEALRQVAFSSVEPTSSAVESVPLHPRLVIFIDEIDNVLNLPFATDEFFAAIRECYTRRAHDPEMRGLTFCLLGSTTPDSLIQDVRTTPFNIGVRIEPTDFTLTEAAPLVTGLNRAGRDGISLLKRTLYWTEGHPYLTQRLCHAVAAEDSVRTAADVDRLCAQLFFTKAAREGESNLTFVSNRILKSNIDRAGLLDLLKQVLAKKQVKNDPSDPFCAILRLSGMVRVVEGTLKVRNRIYGRVFDREWIRANMPDAEWRRQRDAYRRGQMRAAAVFGLIGIALVLSLLGLSAIQKAMISKAHERETAAANVKLKMALEDERRALDQARSEKQMADRAAVLASEAAQQGEADSEEAERQRKLANEHSREATMASEEAKRNLALAKQNERIALASVKDATSARSRLAMLLKRDERVVYPSRIQLADRELQQGNVNAAYNHLRQCIPTAYQADLRGFEWRYLMEQCRDLSSQTIPAHPAGVSAVAYSPGANLIASVGRDSTLPQDGRLSLWDAATGRAIAGIRSPAFRTNRVTFSPDGQRLAASVGDGVLHLIDVTTLSPDTNIQVADGGRALAIAFSPDSKILASGDATGVIQLWDVGTGHHLKSLDRQGASVNELAFSPNGRLLCATFWGQSDAIGKLFDVGTGHETTTLGRRQEMSGNGLEANCLAFSADSQWVAVGCSNRIVYLWQPGDNRPHFRLNPFQGIVTALAFSPDRSLLVTGSDDHRIKIWDVTGLHSGRPGIYPITTLAGHSGIIRAFAFAADGKTLLSAAADGNIKQWSLQSIVNTQYKAGDDTVKAVIASPDGKLLARVGTGNLDSRQPADSDPTIIIYDAATLQRRLVLQNEDEIGFITAAFSSDGRMLATSGEDKQVILWDMRTGQQAGKLQGVQEEVLALAFSPDGKLLATGGQGTHDGIHVRLWNMQTQQQIGKLGPYAGQINVIAFSSDSRLLVTGDNTGDLRWWDMANMEALAPPDGSAHRHSGRPAHAHSGGIFALIFSPSGKWLATGGGDNQIRIWDVPTRQSIATLSGHRDPVVTLAYSPDGKTLASGSRDGVTLWVPNSEQETPVQEALHRMADPAAGIESLTFSTDGRMLVSGQGDGILRFWRTTDTVAGSVPMSSGN